MKMEVLARNQFQAQFTDGIGSHHHKAAADWTKPLTPPTSAIHQHSPQQLQSLPEQQQPLSSSPGFETTATGVPAELYTEPYDVEPPLNRRRSPVQPEALPPTPPSEPTLDHPENDELAVHELMHRLEAELRLAKSRHLACTEVVLPIDLLGRIAADMVRLAEKEPCGIRGCSVFIEFEDEPDNSRRIASLQLGPGTVVTFELYLTLRHDQRRWTARLPQFIKNLTRRGSIMISSDYTLIKNKLYNSFLD